MLKLKTEQEQVEDLNKDQENASGYKPTEDEIDVMRRVTERFGDMRGCDARQDAETLWDNGEKEYEAYMESLNSDDNRSNVNKPISFAIIETELQETIDRNSRPSLAPRENSDIVGTDFANETLKYSFDRGDFDYQYFLAKKEAYIGGTGILFEYYREDKRTVKELKITKDGKTGEEIEEYKDVERIDFDDCYAQYDPIRMWYFDPSANHINKCRDAIRREILNIDEFKRVYGKKRGFKNIEFVVSGGDTFTNAFYEVPKDILEGNSVEVLHYFNRSLDEYYVIANGVLVREAPLPFPHKEIPVVVLYCYKKPNQFYGKGIPAIIKSLVDERNTLSNLRLDYQKYGLLKMFFYDDQIELDEMDLVPRPMGGIPVNTGGRPIQQVLQWIDYGDIKPSTYKEEDLITEDIRRTTGIDDRVQGVSMGGTATEAAILKESSLKRVNMKAKLMEIDSLVRLGRLRMANISYFYTIPKIQRIVQRDGSVKSAKKYRTIRVQGKEYRLDNETGALVMDRTEGYSLIKLDDKKFTKYLECEYDVIFDATFSTPISKPLQQSKVTEMFKTLIANPALINELDPRKAVRRYVQVNDEDYEDWLKKDAASDTDMEALADVENEIMYTGTPLPPTKGATERHSMVHLSETKTTRFQQSDQVAKQLFEQHIKGEAEQIGAEMPKEGMPGEGMPGGDGGAGVPPNMVSQMPNSGLDMGDVMGEGMPPPEATPQGGM